MEEEILKPKIDIECCKIQNNIPPIDQVHIMDEDSFEKFITEWLYACRKKNYEKICHIGGSGDKGRDIIGIYQDDSHDVFQCKHYNAPLSPSEFNIELGKLCYYTWKKEIKIPINYFIIASHNVGPKLYDLINNPEDFKQYIINEWDIRIKYKIISGKKIELTEELKGYINNFDFSIIKTIPIEEIINEHIKTIYGVIRFGVCLRTTPKKITPPSIPRDEELPYIRALLDAYEDEDGSSYRNIEDIKKSRYNNHFMRQREDYYCAETVCRFVRETFSTSDEIDYLKEEVYTGIIDVHEKEYKSGYQRLQADLERVTSINTDKCILDSQFKMIGNHERKGICHELVNDAKLKWVLQDE